MAIDSIPINRKIDKAAASEVVFAIFGSAVRLRDSDEARGPYLEYYNDEVEQLDFGPRNANQTAKLALVTHGDLARLVRILKQNTDKTRPELRKLLRESTFRYTDVKQLNRSINVALRLWLMINIREFEFEVSSRLRRPCLQWNDESKLRSFLYGLFPKPRWELTAREGRYDPRFTIAFMTKICGLKVDWTTTLEDHLRLDRRTKTLWVFPYKSYLRMLSQNEGTLSATTPQHRPLIPLNILTETIDSLLLLFPEPDADTQTLLRAHGQDFNEYEPYEASRPLGILDFDHWRDRLLELYQEVYQVQTPSWYQLWRDQRNPQQWLAFWLGLVIAVLTFVSTLASIVSMVASIDQAWGPKDVQPCICRLT